MELVIEAPKLLQWHLFIVAHTVSKAFSSFQRTAVVYDYVFLGRQSLILSGGV